MQVTENQRIKILRKESKLSQVELASKLGVDQSSISAIENEKNKATKNFKILLSHILNANVEWIESGKGEMFINNKNEIKPFVASKNKGRPFYNVDFTLGFEELNNDDAIYPEFNIDFPPANKAGVNWFRGKGNSMLGEVNSGDYIALEEIQDFSWFPLGRIYGVVTNNGFRTIKRIIQSTNKDEYLLVCSNPDKENYPDQSIPKNIIKKLFKVVFVIKDLDE